MYAVEQSVRNLCKNVKGSLSSEFIAEQGAWADAQIDAVLASSPYYWPNDSDGNPYASVPNLIVQIANRLTAAQCEYLMFAQNEAGQNMANPYARNLEKMALAALERIQNREIEVDGLQMLPIIDSSPSEQRFTLPNSGFGNRSLQTRYRGRGSRFIN